jgi:hypothetical protein
MPTKLGYVSDATEKRPRRGFWRWSGSGARRPRPSLQRRETVMAKQWFVEIVESATDKVELRTGPFPSERSAERCEDGAMRNLCHEAFYTRIVEEGDRHG